MNKNNFTFVDLFSGIGGFRIALNNLGGKCLNFSEISKDAINTYCENFNENSDKNLGDITKIKELPKHNLLIGGVPCQSWSIAGRNLGFDDDRGQLWNDTIFLLNQSKPDAFIFENVKGLVDPRNKEALLYILKRIEDAGYFANYYVLNSFDYGVPQNRVRIYIVGFKNKEFALKFKIPKPLKNKLRLADILEDLDEKPVISEKKYQMDLFGEIINEKTMSLSQSNGLNDYFLFNDLRNGHSTIHSWDIIETTDKQKEICYLLLKNRRKSAYGNLDGNPLSLKHFQDLDNSIKQKDLDDLVKLGIFKEEEYSFVINDIKIDLTEDEKLLLDCNLDKKIIVDLVKTNKDIKIKKISVSKILDSLKEKNVLSCIEKRYDFKNTKISTGLFGVNRVFLPTSDIFPTLVASDTNDFISTSILKSKNEKDYKEEFINNIYKKNNYRKITKKEACLIQGFPKDFILPLHRARWMKLLGNSVSVPVIENIGKAILETGVFDFLNEEKEVFLDNRVPISI
ncbi:MAG: DNA (cytosine-5-)-methyltransferase [Cyanobacteriota bacterium]